MIINNPFKYHGHLDPKKDSLVYIQRKKEEKQVLEGIKKDLSYYAIIGPRQAGKTTFMQQLINGINEDEFHTHETVYVTLEDLSKVEKSDFYSNLVRKIIKGLKSRYSISPASLLTMHEKVSNNLDFEDFLVELSNASLGELSQEDEVLFHSGKKKRYKYVLFIDEVDWMPKELALEFIKTIRAIFTQRSFIKGYDVYSFIISGAIDLAKLTYGRTSPYNIAEQIDLKDFEKEETVDMVKNALASCGVSYYDSFLEELFDATGGHACLTQKVCGKIIDAMLLEKRETIATDDLTKQINTLIESSDITLKTTWEKVKDQKNIEILKKIIDGEEIKYNEYDDFSYELKLAGAVINQNGFCKIRNNLYRRFLMKQFNMT